VLLTLADVALGYAAEGSVDPPARLITASISADFAGSARPGDWVETRVDVQRVGVRMAFANAYLHVRERRVVRASAVFARADAGGGGR
jgi:acyl-coenzyme A thioesterase PaaI-like protein